MVQNVVIGEPLQSNKKLGPELGLSSEDLSRVAQALRKDAIFGSLPTDSQARLLGRVTLRSLEQGEVLQELGQLAEHTYLILSGIFSFDGAGGRTVTLSSGLLGEEAILKMSACATTVTAQSAAEVVVFPRHPLMDIVWANRDLRALMLASFSDRFSLKAGNGAAEGGDEGGEPGPQGPALRGALDRQRRYLEGLSGSSQSLTHLLGWFLVLYCPA